MTKRSVGGALLGLLASITAAAASCSFPTYNITVTGGAGGETTSSSASGTGGAGGSGGASSTSSVTSSGTTTSATSSSTTTTSATSSSTATSTGTGTVCMGTDATCDCDNDKVLAKTCNNGGDCNDHDPLVHTGQMTFFKTPIAGTTDDFDYNCDGAQTFEITDVLACSALDCDTTKLRWKDAPPGCGVFGQLGVCGPPGLGCTIKVTNMQKQGCR